MYDDCTLILSRRNNVRHRAQRKSLILINCPRQNRGTTRPPSTLVKVSNEEKVQVLAWFTRRSISCVPKL
jgi:hypothetical protein